MNEKEMKSLVRDCLKQYYEEDKKILIHSSIVNITSSTYLLYNLVFFRNKIYLEDKTFRMLQSITKQEVTREKDRIRVKNAEYILEAIKRDRDTDYHNYTVINMDEYGDTQESRIYNFLKENPDVIFYLANNDLYSRLKETDIVTQVVYLEKGFKEVNPYRSKIFKFETIGAIRFEEEKMLIAKKDNVILKVFNQKGEERTEEITEVKPRDYILIIGQKENVDSINLYQVVSRHTRNYAIRIIWTDLRKGQESNKYIDRLDYKYRKMILDSFS